MVNALSPSTSFAVATFQGSDTAQYLQVKINPTLIGAGKEAILAAISSITVAPSTVRNRNVGAALRDAINNLKAYQSTGGSILYLIGIKGSESTVRELDVIGDLITYNIQLVAVEAGNVGATAFDRFPQLSQAIYYPLVEYGSAASFDNITAQIVDLSQQPLPSTRKLVSCYIASYLRD